MKKIYEMNDIISDHGIIQDFGQLIYEGFDYGSIENVGKGYLHINLQSWDEEGKDHLLLKSLIGKKIRITVEVGD